MYRKAFLKRTVVLSRVAKRLSRSPRRAREQQRSCLLLLLLRYPPAPFVLSAKTVIVPGMNARSLSFRRRLLSTRSQCSSNGRRSTSTREEKRNLSRSFDFKRRRRRHLTTPSSLPTCFGAPHKPEREKRTRREKKSRIRRRRRSSLSGFVRCRVCLRFGRVPRCVSKPLFFFKGEARFSKKNVGKLTPHLGF